MARVAPGIVASIIPPWPRSPVVPGWIPVAVSSSLSRRTVSTMESDERRDTPAPVMTRVSYSAASSSTVTGPGGGSSLVGIGAYMRATTARGT